jgi:hypothetical protein
MPSNTGRGDRPLPSYAALIALFNGLFGAGLFFSRKKLPVRISAQDVLLVGVASHQLSRVITRDKITTVLRQPFTEVEGPAEEPAELEERARGSGLRRAIGELLTCPYCIGVWIASFLTYGLVLAPRETRVVASTFASATVSDFLHLAYRAAVGHADRAQAEAAAAGAPAAERDAALEEPDHNRLRVKSGKIAA